MAKSDKKNSPPSYADEDRKYKAEDALRTLTRAEELRGDPALMKDVEKCRQDKIRDLAKVKIEVSPMKKIKK